MTTLTTPSAGRIDYPESDGQPMAESDFQRKPLIYTVEALSLYFQDRPDVYVSGNMFLYYEQGNPQAVVAPDVFVVFGAEAKDRPSYLLWREPKAPDFVLEITSRSTRAEDQGSKRGVYAYLGVAEYWQYDPTGDYLFPPLQGSRLVDGNYFPIPVRSGEKGRSGHSEVLGLELRLDADGLRFYEPVADRKLLSYQEAEQGRREAEQGRREAEQRAAQEAAARQSAEARIAELEARLRALRSRSDPSPPES